MVHPMFTIDEVLRAIFQQLSPPLLWTKGHRKPGHNDVTERRRALARCACVCKAFSEPALDALWVHLPDIGALVNIVFVCRGLSGAHQCGQEVNTACECKKPYGLEDVSSREWERLQLYAPRVRSITVDLSPNCFPVGLVDLGHLIRHGGTTSFLPRLFALKWTQRSCVDRTLLSLLHPSIRCLAILVSLTWGSNQEWSRFNLPLGTVFSQAPYLQNLEMMCSYGPRLPLPPLAECKHLTRIKLSDDRVMLHSLRDLSSLPSLTDLIVPAALLGDATPCGGFAALQRLSVTGDLNQDMVINTLCAVPAPHLHSLEIIDVSLAAFGSISTLPSALSVICSSYGSSLRNFTYCWDVTGADHPVVTRFRPLLFLPGLEDVCITNPGGQLPVSDADLRQMARAWPCLRSLVLKPWPKCEPWCFRSLPSLGVLADLADLCPHLEVLYLPWLDARRFDSDSAAGETVPALAHRLWSLTLGFGPVEDPIAVARFIDSVFPHLEYTTFTSTARLVPELAVAQAWTAVRHARWQRAAS